MIFNSTLLPLHYCTTATVLLIRHRTLLHKVQSYLYTKVHYWPSAGPVDTLQSTSDPVLVLLIPFSAILLQYLPCGYDTVHYCQYQSYWYPTVHLCPSTRPVILILYSPLLPQYQSYWYSTVHYCPVTDLLIQHNPLLPQYESYWYPTVHYYPISSSTDMATATVPVILMCPVHNCPSTSPTDTTQSAIVPVPDLLIQRSQLLL